MFLRTNTQHSSNSELLSEEEEFADYFEDKGKDEDEGNTQNPYLDLPAYFLSVPFFAIDTTTAQVVAPQNLKVALESLMLTTLLDERVYQGQ